MGIYEVTYKKLTTGEVKIDIVEMEEFFGDFEQDFVKDIIEEREMSTIEIISMENLRSDINVETLSDCPYGRRFY